MTSDADGLASMIEQMIDAKIENAVRQLHAQLAGAGVRSSFGPPTPTGPTTFELARELEKILRRA
jgi:hypothetical protein